MKILVVVWNFYPDTAYTNRTISTVKGLEENGADVSIVTMKPSRLRHHRLLNKFFLTNKNGLYGAIGTLYGIALLVRAIRHYDIIFCSLSDLRILKLVKLLGRKLGKTIVHERTEMPGIFYPNTPKGKATLESYCKIISQYDHIFVISTAIRQFFMNRGIASNNLSIYPMNVNPSRFIGLNKNTLKQEYIAYCGNMQNSKDGLSDLIEAYGTSKYAKKRFDLFLIGNTPKGDEMTNYNNQLKRLGIIDSVKFIGRVSMNQIPQILTDASVLALCRPRSLQAEGGFPTKLGEYLSTGNPVLVTNVGDIGNYIINDKTGYIANPGDIQAFAEKLDYIATHYDIAKLAGHAGQQLVFNEFNYRVQAGIVYKQLKLTREHSKHHFK